MPEENNIPLSHSVSVVVPVFNEAGNIAELAEAVRKLKLPTPFHIMEVLFIDDGSLDNTEAEIIRAMESDRRIKLIQFERNYGQTSALSAGFHLAKGEIVVCIDGDMQTTPADIPILLEKMAAGFDVVSGWREKRRDGWLRSWLSRLANRLIGWSTGLSLHDYGCTLKAYRKAYLDKIKLYGEMHRFIPVYLQTVGARICEIPVAHKERIWGKSKYGLDRTFKVILDLMVIHFLNRYCNRPIYLFGTAGALSLLISLLSGGYCLYLKFYKNVYLILTPLPLMWLLSFFMGVLFVLLGLLAELLMRVYYESQNKPTYHIKRIVQKP